MAPNGFIQADHGFHLVGAVIASGFQFENAFRDGFASILKYDTRFKVGPWTAPGSYVSPDADNPAPDPSWSIVVDHSRDFQPVRPQP